MKGEPFFDLGNVKICKLLFFYTLNIKKWKKNYKANYTIKHQSGGLIFHRIYVWYMYVSLTVLFSHSS